MMTFDETKAVAGLGDTSRFAKAFDKLESGENVTICFLGGSITQGSLSSTPQTCYAYRVYSYLKEKFPAAKINYVNAGIGGTTSAFGAARADLDVLSHDPDIVLVEFSVNDECTEYFYESYEGLIRKLLYRKKDLAVAALFNFFYENGKSAERIHSKVARYYGIPCASMIGAIYEDVLSGKIEDIGVLSPDGLHPNDEGHELLSRVVINLFEKIYEACSKIGHDYEGDNGQGKRTCSEENENCSSENVPDLGLYEKKPLTENEFENATRLDNRNYEAFLNGFCVDISEQECVSDCFKNGWLGQKLHDKIAFDLSEDNECTGIAIQYCKTMKRPAPVVSVVVDDHEDEKTIIDAAFDETWGDLLDMRQIFLHGEKKAHKLEIEVIDDKGGNAVPFNLVSIIINR